MHSCMAGLRQHARVCMWLAGGHTCFSRVSRCELFLDSQLSCCVSHWRPWRFLLQVRGDDGRRQEGLQGRRGAVPGETL